ncbi:MAG: hypothetical protein HEQ22_04075 [Sphingopyxis sp.]|uniref:hypothetical protein n=1 Tax=Sphingopyxis sp. TaxID=1908224 RepID=UPI003D80F33A
MSLFDAFLAQTRRELTFTRRLMADIESGALAPSSWGMTREQALAFLADIAAERARMIARLAISETTATNAAPRSLLDDHPPFRAQGG